MKVLFTGDVNFGGISDMTAEKADAILERLRPYLCKADIIIPNLECPLTEEGKHQAIKKSGPPLVCAPENIVFIRSIGADAVTAANNHIGDFGEGGVKDTLSLLRQNGVLYAGAGDNIEAAYGAIRFDRDGEKISVLSVCENEFGIAGENKAGAAGYQPRRLLAAIKREKSVSDRVIVVFHGGTEFYPLPSPDTVERYRFICDMGADAVIAGHTHCPQGWEIYEGKPIVYSLGNFMFKALKEKAANDPWYYGYFVILDTKDMSFEAVPYRFDRDVTAITPFEGDEKSAFMAYLAELSEIIGDPEALENYFEGWCYSHALYPKLPEAYGDKAHKSPANLNIVRCEAHHSVLRTYLDVVYREGEDKAKEYADKIAELCVMPL